MSVYSGQRRMPRFALELPMVVRHGDDHETSFESQTENISACGVYFRHHTELDVNSSLQLDITLPPQSFHNNRIRCWGKVVRVDYYEDEKAGIAVEILNYDFMVVHEA